MKYPCLSAWSIAGVIGRVMVVVAALLMTAQRPAAAITLEIDYSYDASNFFGAGNPSGATAGLQAKASLEAVASYYSQILTDTFSSIQTPPALASSSFNGVATWSWSMSFNDPSNGASVVIENATLAADVYRIYAGARPLSGSTLGIGGPGGRGWASDNNGGFFTQAEINQINQTTQNLKTAVEMRGEASGFANWGGVITFDTGSIWNYNHLASPTMGQNDFLSVAIHELGHALGLGASSTWNTYAATANFTGPAATSVYGSNPPLNGARSHWASGTMSTVFGTGTAQEAAMDPDITTGTRKRFTTLDAAALTDIGWTVVAPAPPSYLAADFNEDTFVDGADLALWKSSFGVNANGDANNDNRTDGNDFLIWQRQRGMSPPSTVAGTATLANVPEPHACLLAIGALGTLVAQRRKLAARPR